MHTSVLDTRVCLDDGLVDIESLLDSLITIGMNNNRESFLELRLQGSAKYFIGLVIENTPVSQLSREIRFFYCGGKSLGRTISPELDGIDFDSANIERWRLDELYCVKWNNS